MDLSSAVHYTTIESPLGELLLIGTGETVSGLYMQDGRTAMSVASSWQETPRAFPEARRQLAEYFAGERRRFTVELALDGTPFQRRVWRALQEIPYGETTSYGELARVVGNPSAARAVGLANGRNPVSIIVPCHRVIGANGSLTGFGGGIERKRILLELEAAATAPRLPTGGNRTL